jgi:hypothetical protein
MCDGRSRIRAAVKMPVDFILHLLRCMWSRHTSARRSVGRAGDGLNQEGGAEGLRVGRRRVGWNLTRPRREYGGGELLDGRRDGGRQHGRGRDVRGRGAFEREAVAVLLFRSRRGFAGTLALTGLVAARLSLAGEHEVLFARDASAPEKSDSEDERQQRTGEGFEHRCLYYARTRVRFRSDAQVLNC